MEIGAIKMRCITDLLKADPNYKARFEVLPKKKIIKYTELIKVLFYILEYDKDQICVEKTQLLFWKKARHLWN